MCDKIQANEIIRELRLIRAALEAMQSGLQKASYEKEKEKILDSMSGS